MNRLRITLLVAVALAVAALPATARAGSATDAVKSANSRLSKLLRVSSKPDSDDEQKRAKQVTSSLRDFLDVDELGRDALVDHWQKLDDKQRSDYLELLRSLIEANYIKGLRARLAYDVAYTGESARGDNMLVTTEITAKRKGRPITIAVDYVLRREGKGWKAVDVLTDGVGLVENYRAQFNRIISKESFEGLLQRMRKKLAAEES